MTRPSDASPRRMRDGEQEISKSMYCWTGQSSAKKFQGENAQAVPKLFVKLRPFKSRKSCRSGFPINRERTCRYISKTVLELEPSETSYGVLAA